jgi:hypothetical protein
MFSMPRMNTVYQTLKKLVITAWISSRNNPIPSLLLTIGIFLQISVYLVSINPLYCTTNDAFTDLTRYKNERTDIEVENDVVLRNLESLKSTSPYMNDLLNAKFHLITVGNNDQVYGFQVLQLTSDIYDWNLQLLGTKDDRIGHQGWGTGFGFKISYQLQFAEKIAPNDIVVFVDAFDVITFGFQQEVLNGYLLAIARNVQLQKDGILPTKRSITLTETAPILFAAEWGCMNEIPQPMEGRIDRNPCLNSGSFIGQAKEVARLIKSMKFETDGNDQVDYIYAYKESLVNESLPLVILDHDSDVFLALWNVSLDQMIFNPRNRRWKNRETKGEPVFFHFNGYIKKIDAALDLILGRQHPPNAGAILWHKAWWCRFGPLVSKEQYVFDTSIYALVFMAIAGALLIFPRGIGKVKWMSRILGRTESSVGKLSDAVAEETEGLRGEGAEIAKEW